MNLQLGGVLLLYSGLAAGALWLGASPNSPELSLLLVLAAAICQLSSAAPADYEHWSVVPGLLLAAASAPGSTPIVAVLGAAVLALTRLMLKPRPSQSLAHETPTLGSLLLICLAPAEYKLLTALLAYATLWALLKGGGFAQAALTAPVYLGAVQSAAMHFWGPLLLLPFLIFLQRYQRPEETFGSQIIQAERGLKKQTRATQKALTQVSVVEKFHRLLHELSRREQAFVAFLEAACNLSGAGGGLLFDKKSVLAAKGLNPKSWFPKLREASSNRVPRPKSSRSAVLLKLSQSKPLYLFSEQPLTLEKFETNVRLLEGQLLFALEAIVHRESVASSLHEKSVLVDQLTSNERDLRVLLSGLRALGSSLLKEEVLERARLLVQELRPGWSAEFSGSPAEVAGTEPQIRNRSLRAPLRNSEKDYGSLLIESQADFSQVELQLVHLLALQLANCLENCKLFADITAAHKELAQSQAQLLQSGKMAAVGQLAAGVAHELNSPLAAVSLEANVAQRKLKKENIEGVQTSLERIDRASERATKIIKALLNFSRKEHRPAEPARLDQVVQNTLEMVGHSSTEPRSRLSSTLKNYRKFPCARNRSSRFLPIFCSTLETRSKESSILRSVSSVAPSPKDRRWSCATTAKGWRNLKRSSSPFIPIRKWAKEPAWVSP